MCIRDSYPAGSIKALGGVLQNEQLIYSFSTVAIGLFTWGRNQRGELGQNQGSGQLAGLSSPTQIPGTTWSSLQASQSTTWIGATKSDGSMWVWGENQAGGLGLNNATPGYSSPTQLGTETTWSSEFSLSTTSKAIKTDGTLWTWGTNYNGALGLNETATPANEGRSSPVQVGTDTTWSKVTAGDIGYDSILAIKTDGTLWGWGQAIKDGYEIIIGPGIHNQNK